jgi:hypothetical protein
VSILQSGGLAANADILAWFHGNLTLNTSIIVCARGLNQSTAACSPPCKLGAACYYQAFDQPLPDGSPLKLQIIDPGAKSVLVDTQIDSGKCTMILPCDLPVNNTTVYGQGASIKIALTSGCTIEVDPTTVQGGTPPALNSGQTLAPTSTAVTYTGTLNDPTADNPTTFKPTSVTQVYRSNLVDVQTAMEGVPADGSKCSASKNAETCNGVTIHAHNIIPNPHFSQFFYKQAFDPNGNAQVIQMAGVGSQCGGTGDPSVLPSVPGGHIFVQQHPGACSNSTADRGNPDWVPDAPAPENNESNPNYVASPFYPGYNIITDKNGDGVTMYDSPAFGLADERAALNGFSRVLFQGRTFVISQGSVVACVDWTLQHGVNLSELPAPRVKGVPSSPNTDIDYSGPYSNVQITIFSPPLTQMPSPFSQILEEYSTPDPIEQSLADSGQSVMPPARTGP